MPRALPRVVLALIAGLAIANLARAQIRVMMRNGVTAVEGGRPSCPLCDFPMNPDGHICPRWN